MDTVARQRLAMVIEFDGTRFHGWQRQNNAFTVQEALEIAMANIEGEKSNPQFSAAGRTDTGVHATHMLIHADVLQSLWLKSPMAYIRGMNFHMKEYGVVVHGVKAVADDFHARFDCYERRYQYKIWNRAHKSVLHANYAWWVPQPLDIEDMNQAGHSILGEHDFSSFRASGCQSNSSKRELKQLSASRNGDMITIDVAADAFLYHMVRNLTGSLVAIGSGRWKPDYMYELLQEKNRSLAAETAPAHGLYFTDALYPGFSAQEISGEVG